MLGSRYYCQHPVFPLAKTVADINLEQLGRTDDTEGPRLLQFNLTGFDYTDIAAFLSKAGEETGIRVVKDEKNSDSFFDRSDNAAFAEAGVPSTTLSVSYIFPDYHRPGDEWPKLDYDNMAKVDDAVALGVFRIADSAEAPQWNKANPKTARYVKPAKNKVARHSCLSASLIGTLLSSRVQSRVARQHPRHAGPIQLGLPMRHGGKEMIANEAGQRHGRGALAGRFERQAHVLQPQLQGESRRGELLVGDDASVVSVDRRRKQAVDDFQENVRIDARLSQRREGFPERLDHARQHEIPAQLHRVGLPRLGAGHAGLASDGVE